MTLHPLAVFALGAVLFLIGLVVMTLVLTSVYGNRQTTPQIFRLSIAVPGDYEFKVYPDGVTMLNRVR